MTEEQIKQKFKETYPDFMRGDEPLSPYFDIWEYAIEIVTSELQEELNYAQTHCLFHSDCPNQKENTELKEQNIKDCENFNKTMKEIKEQWNDAHYQFTKAKEIIKSLLRLWNDVMTEETVKALVEEAEQFISEVEK